MKNTSYSASSQAVSRFLGSLGWTRSRTVRGRIANNWTQGFVVRSILGETRVFWVEDSRSYGSPGFTEATKTQEERLDLLAKSLEERFAVSRSEEYLVVSSRLI